MTNNIAFWMLLSELNSYLTVISLNSPEYEERLTDIKIQLRKHIEENLEMSKKLTKLEKKFWTVRNN
jgi:hypothetical protein